MSTKLSPSKLDYLALCPCYTSSFTSSPAAERGKLLHLAVETGDLSEVEPEDVKYVELCQEHMKSTTNKAKALAEAAGEKDIQEFKEVKLEIIPGSNGIIDWMLVAAGVAFIEDWKFGEEPPLPAKENYQLMAYAYAVMKSDFDIHEVRVGYYMPVLELSSQHTYKRIDLEKMELIFISLQARTDDPEKKPQPSPRACQWCGGKATCEALTAIAVKVSMLPVPDQLNPALITKPADLTAAMVLANVVTDWAKQAKAHCTKLAVEDGIETPGFVIKSRAGSKKVIDNVRAREILEGEGLSPDDVLAAGSLSIPKLTDVLSAKVGTTKKAAKETIVTKLETIIVENERSVYLQKERGMTYEEVLQIGS